MKISRDVSDEKSVISLLRALIKYSLCDNDSETSKDDYKICAGDAIQKENAVDFKLFRLSRI
jgi:hypothetical protein